MAVLLPCCQWQNTAFLKEWRAPEKKQKARVRPRREGESGQSLRRHPVSGLWTKPTNRGTKQESGAEILQTGWPLCLEVYVLQSRTTVEKGHWGRGGFFLGGLSVSCQSVWDLHSTHSIYSHTFDVPVCLRSLCTLSSTCLFYNILPCLLLLLPICCFLFPIHFWPPSLRSILLPPLLTSSFTPLLHPSNVGGQQNNIQGVMATGSPLPVVSSCYCPWSYCCLAPTLY